ncbi:MAG: hypothetical protein M3Y76_08080 [Chloroflexota bacterium]|nr:hypothetical protein [Chloroflexota bacterium]
MAKETGAIIQPVRTFRGAVLLHTLVFDWMQHPDASLEMLSSLAAIHRRPFLDAPGFSPWGGKKDSRRSTLSSYYECSKPDYSLKVFTVMRQ